MDDFAATECTGNTMITITQLGTSIIEIAVLETPSEDDISNAMYAISKQTEAAPVGLLADMGGRSRPEAVLDLIFDYVAPRYSKRFIKVALLGEVGDEVLEDIQVAFTAPTSVFSDKHDAMAWLRSQADA